MRILPILAAAMLFTAPAMATKPTPDFLAGGPEGTDAADESSVFIEKNTYRFGHPYRSELGTTPEACAQICSADSNCAAWSLTPASYQLEARCELSYSPGRTSHRPGAMSGMSKTWQPSPERDGEMKYKLATPEGYQPAPETVVDIAPISEPELLGDTPPTITADMLPDPAPEPQSAPELEVAVAPVPEAAPAPVVEVAAAPVADPVIAETPVIETAPVEIVEADPVPKATSPTAKPENLGELAEVPETIEPPLDLKNPAPAPKLVNAVLKPEEEPVVQTVEAAPASKASPLVNAVLKRGTSAAPAPEPEVPPATESYEGAPIFYRTPWTERSADNPDYSVTGPNYIPGDEQATGGYIDGVPDAGS